MKNKILKQNKIKLIYLFYLLPDDIQSKIIFFLTNKERENILHIINKDNNYKSKYLTKNDIQHIIQNLKWVNNINQNNLFYTIYTIICLTLSIVGVILNEITTSIFFIIYGVLGAWTLKQKQNTHWQLMFINISLEIKLFITCILAYILLLLMMGTFLSNTTVVNKSTPNLLLIIQACLIGPFFEEIFFRDYLYEMSSTYNKQKINENIGLFVSSIAFSVIHLTEWNDLWLTFGVYFIAGVILGFLRWQSKCLLYPLCTHMLFNTTMIYI